MKSFGGNLTDKIFMVFGALLVAAVIVGVFTLGEIYHIAPTWTFGLLLGASFVVVIGRGLRRRFRNPLFILFFAGWLCVHVLVMLLVMARLAFPLWILPMAFELWIGYALAFRL